MKPTCTKLRASKTVCDDVHWIQIKTTAQRIHKIILIKQSTQQNAIQALRFSQEPFSMVVKC